MKFSGNPIPATCIGHVVNSCLFARYSQHSSILQTLLGRTPAVAGNRDATLRYVTGLRRAITAHSRRREGDARDLVTPGPNKHVPETARLLSILTGPTMGRREIWMTQGLARRNMSQGEGNADKAYVEKQKNIETVVDNDIFVCL